MTYPIALGTVLEVTDHSRATNAFVVAGYNENQYMQLTKKNDPSVVMTIHPGHAKRIATNGTDSGIKVLNAHNLNDIIVKATEAIVDVPTTIPTVSVAHTSNAPAAKSKKERALEIKAANPTATRKELVAMFVEQLGMTPAGASTYASMK